MNNKIKNSTLAVMFIAIGYILPLCTMHIPKIGNMLLPMHIPVFLCGLICGWQYGLIIGFILPISRAFLFGMPPIYPVAIAMTFELATYGAVSSIIYEKSNYKCMKSLYRSLLIAMIMGRIVWGFIEILLLGLNKFTWEMFITGALITAIPGIVLQLILIPMVMLALKRTGLVPFERIKQTKNI